MWLETETGDVEPRTVNGGETLKHRGALQQTTGQEGKRVTRGEYVLPWGVRTFFLVGTPTVSV